LWLKHVTFRFISDHKKFISPFLDGVPAPYAYARVKEFWNAASTASKREVGGGELAWDSSGQAFTFSWSHIKNRKLTLEHMRQTAQSALSELNLCWHDVLPDGLDPLLHFSSFSLQDVEDDPASPQSLFDRTDNLAVFGKYIDAIWNLLIGNPQSKSTAAARPRRNGRGSPRITYQDAERLSPKKIRQFLELTFALQLAHIRAFLFVCGIPPRAWQVALLLFRRLGDIMRNVRILPNCQVVVSNPEAKQSDLAVFGAFWALPPQLALSLVFYLGVIRPLEIRLLEYLNRGTAEHKAYIFVHMKEMRNHSCVLRPCDVNQVCRESDLNVEVRPLRNITIGIIKRHFPHLNRPSRLNQSPLDGQAQHGPWLTITRYARDNMPTHLDEKQLAVSYSLQYLWGIVLPNDLTQFIAGDGSNARKSSLHALWTARNLVEQSTPGYGMLRQAGVEERKAHAKTLRDEKPFLPFLRAPLSVRPFHVVSGREQIVAHLPPS
jgi:hypothetical protein